MLGCHKLVLGLLPPEKDSLRLPAIRHVEMGILLLLFIFIKLAIKRGVVDLYILAYGAVVRVTPCGADSAAFDDLAL